MPIVTRTHTADAYLVPTPTAAFMQEDRYRQGTWIDHCGRSGYMVHSSGVANSLPAGVTVTFNAGHGTFTWNAPAASAVARYLQVPGIPANRCAGTWYSTPDAVVGSMVTLTFNLDSFQTHAVSIYHLDVAGTRAGRVDVKDAASGALLDQRSLVNYFNGVHFVWNLRGRLRIDIVNTAASNAGASAIFFDPARAVTTRSHQTDMLRIAGPPAGPAVTSLFAFWLGGGARAVPVAEKTHTTSVLPVLRRTVAHSTGTLARQSYTRATSTGSFLRITFVRAHTSNGVAYAVRTRAHTTDVRAAAPIAYPRAHGTSVVPKGFLTRAHTATGGLNAVGGRSHGASTQVSQLAARTVAHAGDADLAGTLVRTHATGTLARRTVAIAHWTSSFRWLVTARLHTAQAFLWQVVTRASTTSTMVWAVRTRAHSTGALARLTPTRAHSTGALARATPTRPHVTSTFRRTTAIRAHSTGATLNFSLVAAHGAAGLALGTLARTHVTSVLKVSVRSRIHAVSAQKWRVVTTEHGTDLAPIYATYREHTSSAELTYPPVAGRWATPRVATRTPADLASKPRQQGSTGRPIGFLLVGPDRISPVLGATPTVLLLKAHTGWAPALGAVREVGGGWYELAGHPEDRDLAGEVVLMATAPGADPAWAKYEVVAPDTYARFALPVAERAAIADSILTRTLAALTSAAARSLVNAIRVLRSWRTYDGRSLVVTSDDGSLAWKAEVLTDPSIGPIRGMDPIP